MQIFNFNSSFCVVDLQIEGMRQRIWMKMIFFCDINLRCLLEFIGLDEDDINQVQWY